MIPGIATPTEIEAVLERGIELVKFFPAEPSGGVSALHAFAGPYGSVRYVPTGGVSAQNLAAYLGVSEVVACDGSWMVKPELLRAGDFARVRQLAAEALRIVADARASRPQATLPTTPEV